MTHLDPNHKFIEAWGVMASTWGVTRSESQVYALLLVKNEAMSAEDIMKELHMSRGSAHAVLHKLMDYELVFKSHIKGVRKEFFSAEPDLWVVMNKLIAYMKRRSMDRFVEMVADITPEKEINATSSHLEKLKLSVKGISYAFNNLVEYLPRLQGELSYAASVPQGQIIQMAARS